ncbi:L,D-transpeptidase [Flavobacteriaceae bacterium TP-CH-4]|uniref:L,D-transpeptidase n=1 Tax=Pelagihabitans pacificus TaxID=2696054 RepID=A0A967E5N1_9FLAO|nr:L,D-transpeptidase [Pelagihabitans pacificus]NHF59597.1 L,D-transpeptidase [Pelagihabitans pacificus]
MFSLFPLRKIGYQWLLLLIMCSCNHRNPGVVDNTFDQTELLQDSIEKRILPINVKVPHDVEVAKYFDYIDSLVARYDSLVPYPLSEHLLIRANPWVIDTLKNTDYYRMKQRDSFVYDQRKMVVLSKGSNLSIPDSLTANRLLQAIENTEIDINIPEFKLRIYEDSVLLYTFPIRVGQNRKRYLAFGDRITDLRTKEGKGFIVAHVKEPDFYNPVDGKQFFLTKRDDGKTTVMPQIPWIETEINGVRNGQMIHPTTNPATLGKAYSNGCIGTKEADAWVIYYHAPIGTKIKIRYDLEVYEEGQVIFLLKDIYGYGN